MSAPISTSSDACRRWQSARKAEGKCIACGLRKLWTRNWCRVCVQKHYPHQRQKCTNCGFAYPINADGKLRSHRSCR